MNSKEKKFLDTWNAKRTIGRRKYVLMYGLLGFGVGLALLFSIVELITNGTLIMSYTISRVIVLPTIGIIIFSNRWDSREKRYEKLVNSVKGSLKKPPIYLKQS